MGRVLLVALFAGCYNPAADRDCKLACITDDHCPVTQSCGASGLCSANGCPGDDGGVPDVGDGRPASCGAGFAQPCLPIPGGTMDLDGVRSTDGDLPCELLDQAAPLPQMCVVSSDQITVNIGFRARGTRPLVLVARSLIVHELSVSSLQTDSANTGAGACTAPSPGGTTGMGQLSLQIGGGGAGGTFQGRGGHGGDAMTDTVGLGGQAPNPLGVPTQVVGGCAGGRGAQGGVPNGFGPGGAGGGAIYLIATETIDVDGAITACGAGAVGGNVNSGGGGGGAGGLIVLDAPMVRLATSARLIAAGGGGAAGHASNPDAPPGEDPHVTAMTPQLVVAVGGMGGAGVGDGGAGSRVGTDAGTPGTPGSNAGGGGGGGGAGFIIIYATQLDQSTGFVVPSFIRM